MGESKCTETTDPRSLRAPPRPSGSDGCPNLKDEVSALYRTEHLREQEREALLNAPDEPAEVATPDELIHVGRSDELKTVLGEYPVVLLEFYADWCGPCRMLELILEDLAATSDAAIAKVDVDETQQLAAQYQVRSVPTIILFSEGPSSSR